MVVTVQNSGMNGIHAENLFRKQAIQSLTRKAPGRPICVMPRSWQWLIGLVVLLFSIVAVFICTAEYARKESVRGWLVSKTGVVRISNNIAAVINTVDRQPGERAEAGDALIFFTTDSTMASGSLKSLSALDDLRDEMSELDLQIELLAEQSRIEGDSIRGQLLALEKELDSQSAEASEHERGIVFAKEKLQRLQRAIDDGAVTRWDVIRQSEELGALLQQSTRLAQNVANRQREREALIGQLGRLPVDTRVQQSLLRARRLQLNRQIAEQESRRLSVLTSPVAGIVASVEVHAGNSIRPGQPLMTLLPLNMDLGAEVFVPSRAVGMMSAGQSVRLSYDAFPRQKFGTFDGRIERVSDYVLLPTEIPPTFPMQEASYKVNIEIDRSTIPTSTGTAPLRPGMLLAAEIILERRSLLTWLLGPLWLNNSSVG